MAAFASHIARLSATRALSDYTWHLDFEMQSVPRFGFVPGQWLSLRHTDAEGHEITRAYSLASEPTDDARFSLCLNRVDGGFMSNFLINMKVGETIECQGPFGDFILRPPLRDTVLIATGTGIAPFRSMLRWLLADPSRHQGKHFWLLFGSRTEADIYYRDEFADLAAQHRNFEFVPTLSRADSSWQGRKGYVQQHVVEIVAGHADMHAYICGLDKMVSANRELLKSLGWDRKQIRYEKYD